MGVNRLVFFRADGNAQIASGHLVRCTSIANACRELGMEVRFLVSDKESEYLIQKKLCADFPVIRLESAVYNQLEKELPELLALLEKVKNQNTIFFLDSYFVNENYLTQIKAYTKVVYLDDLRLFDYPVDLLINYGVISASSIPSYRDAYRNAGRLFLGAEYAPLRSQFLNKKIPVREKVSNILITTGGSDPCHFCVNLIEKLCKMGFWDKAASLGITIRLLVGYMNSDKASLASFAEKLPALKLYENIVDMASFMEKCDFAISAAGTTLFELCALGLPAISYTMADNQLYIANAFASENIIPYAGDIRTDLKQVLELVCQFLTEMTEEKNDTYSKRKSAHETMRRFIDGSGSVKIAEAVFSL
ncbi:MAG: UDP-2,4-diacetamido-2,4,6-trideoxy-beta-L-altropyranose hydrolase [Lachnospiraceae bacterium]|nr:UDP-2,4-diacetamido-2,4,6-trideoxy-beta-L-altropyranose hydrolase [Lachnospiraceae bacterium]